MGVFFSSRQRQEGAGQRAGQSEQAGRLRRGGIIIMVKATLAILALGLAQVAVADKWSDLKTQTYLDKKKRHRNLEEAKMDSSGTKKKNESTTENYLKDERWQLCQSVDEADVKNTLLK